VRSFARCSTRNQIHCTVPAPEGGAPCPTNPCQEKVSRFLYIKSRNSQKKCKKSKLKKIIKKGLFYKLKFT